MVDVVLHFAVPFAALCAVGVRKREALFASIAATLPDLDALFHVHRSLTHSAVVLAVAFAVLFVLTRKKKTLNRLAVLGTIGLFTHLFLDTFTSYTPLLWPLYDQSLFIVTKLETHIAGQPSFKLTLDLLTKPTIFVAFETYDTTVAATASMGIALLLIAPIMVCSVLRWYAHGRRRSDRVVQASILPVSAGMDALERDRGNS